MTMELLKTKLYVPPLRPEWVSRPRLVERFKVGLQSKLILVSAPAGFGKTAMVSEGLSSSEIPFGWVSLDEGDNDPTYFWSYFISALQTVLADMGKSALGLFQSPQPPPIESIITTIINEMSEVSKEFALVLDDYHVIRDQSIQNALTFFLDHLPPNMHLIIATRADPSLPVARLRSRGQLTELRSNDLRFTHDEVVEFLSQVMGLELSADDVAALASRTEGWIAGLQMAAVSMQGKDDVTSFIHAFTGSNRYIMDYLIEEVLQRQPTHIQAFLLQTAILDRLNSSLCDAVTDREDSQSILDRIEKANLFIVPLDNERRWYRYHHLFNDLLRSRLYQVQPDLVPTLHSRASEWHEHNGLVGASIAHALSAGDVEQATCLIEQAAEATLLRSEVATLLSWVEALPDDMVRARPLLCVFHAAALLMSGRPLEAVESRLQDATEADTACRVSGEVTVIRAWLAALQGDMPQSSELSHRALELLPEESLFLRGMVAGYLGFTYMLNGDVVAASRVYGEAARIDQKAGNVMLTVVALCRLGQLSVMRGKLYEAKALYGQALALAVDEQGQPLPIAGSALIGLGELLYEWNDLEAATRYLTEGIQLTNKWVMIWAIYGYVALAHVKQAQGEVDGADEAIQAAQQLAMKFDISQLEDIFVAAHQTRLFLAQDNLKAAVRWAEERGLDKDAGSGELEEEGGSASSSYLLREIELITLARVHLAQGRPYKTLEVLKPLLQAAANQRRIGNVTEIMALQALAVQAQGDTHQATTVLEQALSIAEPEGYVRTFIDEGPPMARLLYEAATRGIAPEYTGRLLAAFPTPEAVANFQKLPAEMMEALSDREIEVLELIAEGLSNQEVAQRLFISPRTVKWHNGNIYGKLGVKNRTQAIAKAKALGILSTT